MGVAPHRRPPTVGTGPASECGATMEGTTGWEDVGWVSEGREIVTAHRTRAVHERSLRGWLVNGRGVTVWMGM